MTRVIMYIRDLTSAKVLPCENSRKRTEEWLFQLPVFLGMIPNTYIPGFPDIWTFFSIFL